MITGLEQEPGRKERSIADTSWDTWFDFIGGHFGGSGMGFSNNWVNTSYSYYDGGQALGFLLDLEIRHATGNRKSLVDWMRLMYQRYALPKPGFEPEDAIRAATETAGTDMSAFFRQYVTGKEPLPYERDFGYAGIRVEKSYSPDPWLGITVEPDQQRNLVIANVIPGSPAEKEGLDRGDVVIALDGKAVDPANYASELKTRHQGDRLVLMVKRFGQLQQIAVTIATNPAPAFTLKPIDDPTESQRQLYRGMLNVP